MKDNWRVKRDTWLDGDDDDDADDGVWLDCWLPLTTEHSFYVFLIKICTCETLQWINLGDQRVYTHISAEFLTTRKDASVNCCCAVADNMEGNGDEILRLNKSVNNWKLILIYCRIKITHCWKWMFGISKLSFHWIRITSTIPTASLTHSFAPTLLQNRIQN